MSDWISINKKLPLELEEIIFLTEKDGVQIGFVDRETADGIESGPLLFFSKDDGFGISHFWSLTEVSHWMPLPDPHRVRFWVEK